MTNDPDLHCRVCGYQWDDPPWGANGKLASFDLCPCCWVQTGYEDATPSGAREYRANWLRRGAPWSTPAVDTDGLTTEERLAHVPPGYEDQP